MIEDNPRLRFFAFDFRSCPFSGTALVVSQTLIDGCHVYASGGGYVCRTAQACSRRVDHCLITGVSMPLRGVGVVFACRRSATLTNGKQLDIGLKPNATSCRRSATCVDTLTCVDTFQRKASCASFCSGGTGHVNQDILFAALVPYG